MLQHWSLIIVLVNYTHVNHLRTSLYIAWICSNLNIKKSSFRHYRKAHFCYLLKSSPTFTISVKIQHWESETEYLTGWSRALQIRDAELPLSQSSITSFQHSNTDLYLTSAYCIARKQHRESHSMHHSYIKILRHHAEMKEFKIKYGQQDFSC